MRNTPALLFAAAVALAVRLVAILKFGPSAIKFGDAPDYISAAMSLCSTGTYPDRRLWTALYLMALMGWNLLRRRDPRMAMWCVVGALVFWISQVPFQVVSRFRIPVTDPFLIVFAAAWVTSVLGRKQTLR